MVGSKIQFNNNSDVVQKDILVCPKLSIKTNVVFGPSITDNRFWPITLRNFVIKNTILQH